MHISTLLQNHASTAVQLGSPVDGETTVVLAGYAARQGYAPWWTATLPAAAVNLGLDQGYCAPGRWRGGWLLAHQPRPRSSVGRVTPLLQRHRAWVIFSVQFRCGLRTAGPLALGITRVPWNDFVVFNVGLGWFAHHRWRLRSTTGPR